MVESLSTRFFSRVNLLAQLLAMEGVGRVEMDSSGPSPSWKDPPSCQGRLVGWPQQVLSQPGTLVPGPGAQSLTLATSSLTSLHPKPSSCPQHLTGCLSTVGHPI